MMQYHNGNKKYIFCVITMSDSNFGNQYTNFQQISMLHFLRDGYHYKSS